MPARSHLRCAPYDPPDLTSGPAPTTYTYDLDKNIESMTQPGPRLVEYGYL